MYTVNQGPSKLVAKTRTGLSQNYEKIESIRKIKVNNGQTAKMNAGHSRNGSDNRNMDINVAKPVFQEYRRSNSNRSNTNHKNSVRIGCFNDEDDTQQILSPQYEELIRYISDSWNVLSTENDANNDQGSSTDHTSSASSMDSLQSDQNGFKTIKKVIVYHNDPPSPALENFGPFDLESWWGRRLFNNITKSL